MKVIFLSLLLFSQASLAGTIVLFETTKGNFEIELNDEKAPITVKNFLNYVDNGFYDGTIFHRTVKNFVVQGGGHNPDMTEKPADAPIPSEAKNGLSNLKGTIGMARAEDINSATSQFYINTKDNLGLDYSETRPGYTVFGKVISGYEVIEAIENSKVHDVGEYQHVPVEPIVVKNAWSKKNYTVSQCIQKCDISSDCLHLGSIDKKYYMNFRMLSHFAYSEAVNLEFSDSCKIKFEKNGDQIKTNAEQDCVLEKETHEYGYERAIFPSNLTAQKTNSELQELIFTGNLPSYVLASTEPGMEYKAGEKVLAVGLYSLESKKIMVMSTDNTGCIDYPVEW